MSCLESMDCLGTGVPLRDGGLPRNWKHRSVHFILQPRLGSSVPWEPDLLSAKLESIWSRNWALASTLWTGVNSADRISAAFFCLGPTWAYIIVSTTDSESGTAYCTCRMDTSSIPKIHPIQVLTCT